MTTDEILDDVVRTKNAGRFYSPEFVENLALRIASLELQNKLLWSACRWHLASNINLQEPANGI